MGFKETSAKTGLSVDQTFTDFATELLKRRKERNDLDVHIQPKPEIRTVVVRKEDTSQKKGKCKC